MAEPKTMRELRVLCVELQTAIREKMLTLPEGEHDLQTALWNLLGDCAGDLEILKRRIERGAALEDGIAGKVLVLRL